MDIVTIEAESASCDSDEIRISIQKRLKRAEGQVRGVMRMVEQEIPCTEILMQISAARSALRQAGLSILKRHVETCVSRAIVNKDEGREDLIDEMIRVVDRYGI